MQSAFIEGPCAIRDVSRILTFYGVQAKPVGMFATVNLCAFVAGIRVLALPHEASKENLMRILLLCTMLFIQLIFVDTACAAAGELTEAGYRAENSVKGVVLLDVDLGRYGRCGGNETAQLRRISFNRMPLTEIKADSPADAEVAGPSLPTVAARGMRNYAFLLSPGEYAMTRISIRVTQSISQVGYLEMGPEQLAPGGSAKAGSFRVSAGEIIYIGNFKIDCSPPMTLWRYYTEGKANFAEHLLQYRQSFPFLSSDDVHYRLFETKTIGAPYTLK